VAIVPTRQASDTTPLSPEEGVRGIELREAVDGDLARAATLLDTGPWSFNLLAHGPV
jgi:hypothetical protein